MQRIARIATHSAVAAGLFGLGAGAQAGSPSYIQSVSPGDVMDIVPLLTVGEEIGGYAMSGIPDGLGAYQTSPVSLRLFMNHELGQTQGIVRTHGGTGAFISQWDFGFTPGGTPNLTPIVGQDSILNVLDWNDATGVYGPVAAGRFHRLCSAYLAGPHDGLTDYMFLTGEETNENNTLDGVDGGQSFAVINGTAWALPRFGRFAKENQVILTDSGSKTVAIVLDDSSPSQLYIYVGQKVSSSADLLLRNGLSNGQLYVLTVAGEDTANDLVKGEPKKFKLREIDWSLPEAQLRPAAAALGALNFVRIEDGTQDRNNPNVFYFVTTGGQGTGNDNGQLIKLRFRTVNNPLAGGSIEVLLDGSEGVISPDNVDINDAGQLMLCEDPTFTLTGRDSSLWCYNVGTAGLTRLFEMDTALAQTLDATYTLGKWETSGIIDASNILGEGWWLLDVQAHYNIADPELVQGGQLLAVRVAVPQDSPAVADGAADLLPAVSDSDTPAAAPVDPADAN